MHEGFELPVLLYYRLMCENRCSKSSQASRAKTVRQDSGNSARSAEGDDLLKQNLGVSEGLAKQRHIAVRRKVEGLVQRRLDAAANHGRIRPAA